MYVPKNSRRMRRLAKKQPIPIPPGTKFCYIEYLQKDKVTHDHWTSDYVIVPGKKLKRWFDSYNKAIAQLTKVKLNIVEDVEPWLSATPCKIVEGCYTNGGKKQVTKVTDIPNEHNRSEERDDGSGLSRKQQKLAEFRARRRGVSVSQTMGDSWATTWGSGLAVGSSYATAVVDNWDEATRLSRELEGLIATIN